jgi:SAM-dependent methyltransferase
MFNDTEDITAFYNQDPQREHARLDRHQLEYDLTWRFFSQYLPPSGSILEIGAATGRYTLGLAERGYAVTAVDFSAALLEQNRAFLQAAGLAHQVQYVLADARDLSAVTGNGYDAVLLMGPLYHLGLESDRSLALAQAVARLRPGGLLFSAWISRLGTLGDLMKKVPDWILNQSEVQSFLTNGRRPEDAPVGDFRGYFAAAAEIPPLHERQGLLTRALVAVEPAISADDESYNRLQGELRQRWLDVLYAVSAEPSILAASRHLLYIGQKPA